MHRKGIDSYFLTYLTSVTIPGKGRESKREEGGSTIRISWKATCATEPALRRSIRMIEKRVKTAEKGESVRRHGRRKGRGVLKLI